MIEQLLIPARYCGPPDSANGGFTAGSLASRLRDIDPERPVTVRLHQPPPLDASLLVTHEGDEEPPKVTLSFGGAVVASASPYDGDLEAVEPVSAAEAEQAATRFPGHTWHPFATCFACGTGRPDGLRIFPGAVDPLEGHHRVAAPWTCPEATPDASDVATAWAALDCIGGWAGGFGEERLMVLGSMAAHIEALPTPGEPHVVMGQSLGQEGRKSYTAATLYDSDGRIVGLAEHTWISVDRSAFPAPANA